MNSLTAAITVSGVEYTAALGDTSSSDFMEAAELWEERVSAYLFNLDFSTFHINRQIYLFIYILLLLSLSNIRRIWKVKRGTESACNPRVSPPRIKTDWDEQMDHYTRVSSYS